MSAVSRAALLLAACLPPDRREELLGDLEEERLARARTFGAGAAQRWYAAQILTSLPPVICRWLRTRAMATVTAIGMPSTGAIFFAVAILWFGAVAWTLPFDGRPGPVAAAPEKPPQAATVTLQDGAARVVYWLAEPIPGEHFGTLALMRFSIVALTPPALAAIAIVLILSILETRRSVEAGRRRVTVLSRN